MVDKIPVAVLGATGLVGQRFVARLAKHPWFELSLITASESKSGMRYKDAVNWIIDDPFPEEINDLRLQKTDAENIIKSNIEIAFVSLPSSVAENIEPVLAKAGLIVVSNASFLRMEKDMPLINPEVNASHIKLIKKQRNLREWKGLIVKVPNCTTAILTLSLKPLLNSFGIEEVYVTCMQSVSGAGFNGVPSLAIIDNIIPYIKGEEYKVENESLKILGTFERDAIREAKLKISATCVRVPVIDGHMESVTVKLSRKATTEEVIEVLKNYRGEIKNMDLPSKPKEPIIVMPRKDRPQPRLDRKASNGMSITVGRIREALEGEAIKYIVLGHNTVRGAAGTGILIGELIKRTFLDNLPIEPY
jgi:aspartate-semialdehyde dehydrogenase